MVLKDKEHLEIAYKKLLLRFRDNFRVWRNEDGCMVIGTSSKMIIPYDYEFTKVGFYVIFETTRKRNKLIQAIKAMGGDIVATGDEAMTGYAPIEHTEALAQLFKIRRVTQKMRDAGKMRAI